MNGDFQVGPWTVRPSLNTVSQNGTSARLEPKVMEVLVCLASQAGETVSKQAILKIVWPDTFVSDDVLVRSISELRRVFRDDAREARFIETIPKRGYRLLAPVERLHGSLSEVAPQEQIAGDVNDIAHPISSRSWVITTGAIFCLFVVLGIIVSLNVYGLRDRLYGTKGPIIRSLAVLPLQNLSDDANQEYFAEGMTDALITNLAQISVLKVVSRTTIARYGHPDKPLSQIARELNVDGIVEGTVQRSGDRLRVTAQLIYGPGDQHLWASSYERDIGDVLAIEADIATAVARQIQLQVSPAEQQRLTRMRAVTAKALEAYWQGRHYLDTAEAVGLLNGKWELHQQALQKSVESFERALAEDSEYVPACLGLWDTGNTTEFHPEMRPRAVKALFKALTLDDSNVRAHLDYAFYLNTYKWDWTGAEHEYKRSLELDPTSALAHESYAQFLDNAGRLEEGKKEHEVVQELSPDINNPGTRSQSPLVPLPVRLDRLLQFAATHEAVEGDDLELGWMLARMGRYEEAEGRFEKIMVSLDYKNEASDLHRAYKQKGFQGSMREWARQAEQLAQTRWIPKYWPAQIYVALGDHDRAMFWLERDYEEHEGEILALNAHFVWDPLRSDPRFTALLRRVGLPK